MHRKPIMPGLFSWNQGEKERPSLERTGNVRDWVVSEAQEEKKGPGEKPGPWFESPRQRLIPHMLESWIRTIFNAWSVSRTTAWE